MSAPLTFLFTDLENSTQLWERAPDAMRTALAQHDGLLHRVIEDHAGRVVKDTGDGVMAVFASPIEAIAGAFDAQRAIAAFAWPAETGQLKVRMGVHTGESHERDGDFFGRTLNLAARVMGIGHGGQILVSGATAHLVGGDLPNQAHLESVGDHRLKGIAEPVAVYQLHHPDLAKDFPPLKSLSVLKHNLPGSLSTFIGREDELSEAQARLGETRLLTLLGSGGMGKTRLMLRVAEEVVDRFADGVWLVELAPVTDPSTIAERVAAVFNVQALSDRPMVDALVDYLRQKDLLLLVDNAEHLVADVATLVRMLLERCPQLKVLVTSREPLSIPGEASLPVMSLSMPESSQGLAALRDTEAVQLFEERARAVRSDFAVTSDNAKAVGEIVRRLDGIPLALELAAARLRILGVGQIADRLGDRFRLLSGGGRTAVPRQQTLQAAIDWSWELLDETERRLLARLAVFAGGWSLEAAQAITSDDQLDEYEVLDGLERLVDKSLVVAQFSASGQARYRMLESIRSYAADRLEELGDTQRMRERHAAFYTALGETAAPLMLGVDGPEWVRRMALEADNLRAGIEWLLDNRPDEALRIVGILFEREAHWITPREAGSWTSTAVEAARIRMEPYESAVDAGDFVRALSAYGVARGLLGDPVAAEQTFAEAWERGKRAGEKRLVAAAVAMRTLQLLFRMPPEWMDEVEATIAMCREEGYDLELAMVLMVTGYYLSFGDSPEAALPYWRESIALVDSIGASHLFLADRMRVFAAAGEGDVAGAIREAGDWVDRSEAIGARRSTAQALSELAHLLRGAGDLAEAKERYRDAIVLWQEVGQLPAVAHVIECVAYIAIAEGEVDHAATLIGAAVAARRTLDSPIKDPKELAEMADAMDRLAAAMGAQDRDTTIAAGERLNLDAAVELVRAMRD
jgi:predicted ATPase/class 3 adenylate cyclase